MSREQLLAHDDWARAVAFSVTLDEDGVRLDTLELDHDRPELLPTDLERETAEKALLTRRTVFEEEAQPQRPLLGFLVTHDGDPEVVVVVDRVLAVRTPRDAALDGRADRGPAEPGHRARARRRAARRRPGRRDGGVAAEVASSSPR